MKRQQGQSVVEFALIAPIVFLMIFGMIWGGIMFMEYMHYSNAVRTAARQIAVVNDSQRDAMVTSQKAWLQGLWKEEVGVEFYEPKVDIAPITSESTDVVIKVYFTRVAAVPVILDWVDFPPKTIKTLQYQMRLERAANNTTTSTSTEGNTNTGGETGETPSEGSESTGG